MKISNINFEGAALLESDDITKSFNSSMTDGPTQAEQDFRLQPDFTGRSEIESQLKMLFGSQNKLENEIDIIKTVIKLIGQRIGELDHDLMRVAQAVTKPGVINKLLANKQPSRRIQQVSNKPKRFR